MRPNNIAPIRSFLPPNAEQHLSTENPHLAHLARGNRAQRESTIAHIAVFTTISSCVISSGYLAIEGLKLQIEAGRVDQHAFTHYLHAACLLITALKIAFFIEPCLPPEN